MTSCLTTVVEPAYKHDCDYCLFLYNLESNGQSVDVYSSCEIDGNNPLLIRRSDEPSDYITVNTQILIWHYMRDTDSNWKGE